ncbi:MAG TPA: hypothetical protein VM933_05160 [Acidimicrobiales bacterium]|nr:hypothetical protein [Acidimicrobiales bacterium]
MSAALLIAVAQHSEEVKPLSGRSMLITLAVIAAICAAILLAGFGYFSPGNDD